MWGIRKPVGATVGEVDASAKRFDRPDEAAAHFAAAAATARRFGSKPWAECAGAER